MHLHEFIRDNISDIGNKWQEFAKSLDPSIGEMSGADLRDHIEELLGSIIYDITSSQSLDEQVAKSKGSFTGNMKKSAITHADQRIGKGFKIREMVAEYRALRASVLAEWAKTQEQSEATDEITRFSETIDEAIVVAIDRFEMTIKHIQDQFLAILGHDLKNPLGAIITCTDLIGTSDQLTVDTLQYANIMKLSAKRMTKLIDDLLDFARASLGGGIPIATSSMDLKVVCLAIIQEFQTSYRNRSFNFSSEGNVRGEWDENRLAQLISNLISNALQYGSIAHDIDIKVKDSGKTVILEIHNYGPPITSGVIMQIFDPMFRGNPTGRKEKSNLGLGLYIAQEIVKAHQGAINVISTEVEGTTFSVFLPRSI
jgi:signal transduction histidine kinase